ncbi:hypothetical protein DY000_02009137 [Brassica cretica]|uniref:FRIGIDA-like protein n=1 Tax=Brassica cretica TaxID=69181 RepID=A0ABQ7C873_BRACR|nr:hypothetical protein DY000_02009137 [Brassica cretica]
MLNPMIADLDRLYELMDSTHQGSSRLRALREELKNLSREREEAEKTEIDKKESEKEVDTVEYWKKKASRLENSLEESRESKLRLVESLKTMETLKTGEGFLSFILENSPLLWGISGVKEFEEFKREVLEKGKASKREITFDTDLFGSKKFLIFVETVYSKTGKKMGINYIGMEVTDQVRKREKMAKLGEDNAVRKAMESELGKTIHITAWLRFSSITKLDEEQRRLLIEMISSAGLALERINAFLDLFQAEIMGGQFPLTSQVSARSVLHYYLTMIHYIRCHKIPGLKWNLVIMLR